MTKDGPCLVEVNCRCGGFNGSWVPLAEALTGYSQVSAIVDAFISPDAFAALPALPPAPFKMAGCNPFLVSKQEGIVRATPGFDAIKTLRSFATVDQNVRVGDRQERTIDLFTQPGQCVLIHADADVVDADVAAIRRLEDEGKLFVIDEDVATNAAKVLTSPEMRHRGFSGEELPPLQLSGAVGAQAA